MSLAALADVLQAPLAGRDAEFTGVGTDTRTLKAGELFVALRGANGDGHNFLAEASAAGAAGALLERRVETTLPHLLVADTRRALGALAAFWRRQFDIPVVAVTGSNGKTTVKDMIGAILGRAGPGCVTQGNLNNDIGVPLTLLRMRAGDRHAVIEMGMNHRGEIEYLTRLARPTIALVINAAEAHLQGLGGVEEVARAKGEIFSGLTEDGVAVINADDAYCDLWRRLAAPHRCLSFGLDNPADVSARYALDAAGSAIRLITNHGEIDMRLSLLGRHNVMNALAATTTALAAGAALPEIRSGLERLKPAPGRLEVKEGVSGARLIDDTYNANPGSLAAGLQVLKEFGGERVLVLGDMAELGAAAEGIHRRVGELAHRIGIQRLFAVGELARHAVRAFGQGGRHFTSHEALVEALQDCMHGDMTVLVKGSRLMRMERIVAGIQRGGAARRNENRETA